MRIVALQIDSFGIFKSLGLDIAIIQDQQHGDRQGEEQQVLEQLQEALPEQLG